MVIFYSDLLSDGYSLGYDIPIQGGHEGWINAIKAVSMMYEYYTYLFNRVEILDITQMKPTFNYYQDIVIIIFIYFKQWDRINILSAKVEICPLPNTYLPMLFIVYHLFVWTV